MAEAEANAETSNVHTTSESPFNSFTNYLKDLVKKGNERKLELQNPQGKSIFRLSLTWLAGLAVVALISRLAFLLVIAALVLLIMKYQFAIVREHSVDKSEHIDDTPPAPTIQKE